MDIKDLLDVPPWEWTGEASEIVLDALTDKRNEPDRLIAAELAGELVVMNDEMAETLLEIVSSGSESEKLRARAVIALGPVLEEADTEFADGKFDDPEAVPIREHTFLALVDALRRLYVDDHIPREVRRRILEASARAPQDWHADAVRNAYSSGDKDWVLTAVFCMSSVRGFETEILECLKNADPLIHFQAVRAAGHSELAAAWPHVVDLVNDPATPKPLRLAAIEAVGNIHPREARKVLAALSNSPDQEIAHAADEVLGMAAAMSGELEAEEDENKTEWIN